MKTPYLFLFMIVYFAFEVAQAQVKSGGGVVDKNGKHIIVTDPNLMPKIYKVPAFLKAVDSKVQEVLKNASSSCEKQNVTFSTVKDLYLHLSSAYLARSVSGQLLLQDSSEICHKDGPLSEVEPQDNTISDCVFDKKVQAQIHQLAEEEQLDLYLYMMEQISFEDSLKMKRDLKSFTRQAAKNDK